MIEDSDKFIDIIKDELNHNPVNNFDEIMALRDLIDTIDNNLSLKTDTSILPAVFNITADNNESANKLKSMIDSHIEVSRYNHRYVVSTSQLNNIIMIQLTDKNL